MEFSINPNCLYRKMPLADSLARIKAQGYDFFELWSLQDGQKESIEKLIDEYQMQLVAICPNYFILNQESCHDAYEQSLRQAIADAKTLHCPNLITQVGADTGKPRDVQHNAIVKGLKRVAPLLEEAGITLLVEPLNDVKDHKGYYLTSSVEAFEILKEVNSKNILLLYDIYHQLHMGEDVEKQILENLPWIGHFHVAGFPNRDDKIFTNYDYAPLLERIKHSGTKSKVGIELMPAAHTDADALLGKLSAYR